MPLRFAPYSQDRGSSGASVARSLIVLFRRAAEIVDKILRGAGRNTGRATDQVRFGGKPDNGAGARPHCASLIARPRRLGDRVRWRREFVGLVAVQPLRKPGIGWASQRS